MVDESADMDTDEARETSGATTAPLIRYVRGRGGERAVVDVLELAGTALTAVELEDPATRVGRDARVRLFEAATAVLADPGALRAVGAQALRDGLSSPAGMLLRGMGTPRAVYRRLPRLVPGLTATSRMQVVAVSGREAVIRYRPHDGDRRSRLDCEYVQGLLSAVPGLLGRADGAVEHGPCPADGVEPCEYRVTWSGRRRSRRRDGGRRYGRPVAPSRREERRATALLDLSLQLARATGTAAVAQVVTDALPGIVGSRGASLMLWDPSRGTLQAVAATGHDPEQQAALLRTEIRADQTPELVELLTRREPVCYRLPGTSAELAAVMRSTGAETRHAAVFRGPPK